MRTTSDERRDIAENLRYMNRYERICYKEQSFDELAVMVDTFRPLALGEGGTTVDDGRYATGADGAEFGAHGTDHHGDH